MIDISQNDLMFFNRTALAGSFIFFLLVTTINMAIRGKKAKEEGASEGFSAWKISDQVGIYLRSLITLQTMAVPLWCILFGFAGHDILGVWKIFPIEISILGLVLVWGSQFIFLVSQYQMGKAWRIGLDEDPQLLVTSGLFGVMRNPIYTCSVMLTIGVFLLSPSPWTIWLTFNSVIFVSLQTRLEEQFLFASHGEKYLNYTRNVGRFLPGIGLNK